MLIAAVQLLFNAACGFSGCSLLDAFALTTYNLAWTFGPGVLLALDEDRCGAELLAEPAHYRESAAAHWLTPRMLGAWAVRATVQAAVVLGITAAAIGGGDGTAAGGAAGGLARGDSPDPSALGYAVYTSVIIVQVRRGGRAEGASGDDGCGARESYRRIPPHPQMATLATEMRAPTRANYAVNAAALLLYLATFALRDTGVGLGAGAQGVGAALIAAGAAWAAGALAVAVAAGPWVGLALSRGAEPQRRGGVTDIYRGLSAPTSATRDHGTHGDGTPHQWTAGLEGPAFAKGGIAQEREPFRGALLV